MEGLLNIESLIEMKNNFRIGNWINKNSIISQAIIFWGGVEWRERGGEGGWTKVQSIR